MDWLKSSFSTGNSNCVHARRDGGTVHLMDSHNPDRTIETPVDDMKAFIQGVKAGEFDAMLND